MFKKLFIITFVIILFQGSILNVSAQMMGFGNNNFVSGSNCKEPDSYYESLGEKYIVSMVGEEQNKLMDERMGEDLSKTMELRMGKTVSGCLNGGFYGMMNSFGFNPYSMMGNYGNYYLSWATTFVVQILIIVSLVLFIIFLWKKINQDKRRK